MREILIRSYIKDISPSGLNRQFLQLFDFGCFYWCWPCPQRRVSVCMSYRQQMAASSKPEGQKGLLQEKTKQKAHCPALAVCCCWQGHIVDQWQNSAMRASLSSPRLGKQRALFLCAAFTARKEPGGFLNNRIDTSLNYRCEQSVTSEPLYNLTAHTMPQYCP